MEFDFLTHLPVILPELGLMLMVLVVLALDVGFVGLFPPLPESQKRIIPIVAAVGLGVLAFSPFLTNLFGTLPGPYWGGMVRNDLLAQIFKVMIILAGAITCLMTIDVKGVGRKGEFYVIVITATMGGTLMSAAADLIMVFVALETVSIPLYILAAFKRNDDRSSESGMKYFLFGSFASAIFLFGLSLLYGFTGSTNIYNLAGLLGSGAFANTAVPVLFAMVLTVVGFGFKVSAVPFHFWTPDVYEGAPTPVTAFVSVASKAASFALLVRFFVAVFPATLAVGGENVQQFWVNLMAASSLITMTLGNVIALSQRNIKRMLAYSSIAQAGYTLMGVAAIQAGTPEASAQAVASVGFYMFMYTFTNLLAFTVIVLYGEATGDESIAGLAGLNRRSPWLALTMTIALLSLGGVPPAAGFFGKFFVFKAAVESGLVWLALAGVLNAIVALYYYLVVIKVMYVDRSADEDKPIPMSPAYGWVLGITTALVIILGTFGAQPIFEWAVKGARALFNL
jgi:NADH-quinone oxidoreductase subunit N